MALSRGILWCVATVMLIKITGVSMTSTETAARSTTSGPDGVPIVALYPLTKSAQGKDVIGQNNDIQFSREPQTWVKGPTGVPDTAKSVCSPSDYEGILGIDNHDRRLSIKPSMSFFAYIKHYKQGPIMEYDHADTPGPAEMPADPGSYYTVPSVYFMVHYNDPTAFFFNMPDVDPTPAFSSGPSKLTEGQWQHVGFTFDDATKAFRFWVNGVVVSTQTLPGGLAGSTDRDRIRLGYRANYQCLKTEMMCVSFHAVALAENDVEKLIETCREYAFDGSASSSPPTWASSNPVVIGLLSAILVVLVIGSVIGCQVCRKMSNGRRNEESPPKTNPDDSASQNNKRAEENDYEDLPTCPSSK